MANAKCVAHYVRLVLIANQNAQAVMMDMSTTLLHQVVQQTVLQ